MCTTLSPVQPLLFVNHYDGANDVGGDIPVYHIDLYRIESVDELHEIGLEETLLQQDAIKLIEWSEHAVGVLPDKRYEVRFTTLDEEDCRKIEVVLQDGVPAVLSHTEQVFSG